MSGKQITVDVDTLNELVEAKVKEKLAAATTEMMAPLERRMQEAAIQNSIPQKEDLRPFESPLTGATAQARVLTSRSFPKGRIVDLEHYTHPAGVDVHVADGGLVPDGKEIGTTDHKMWKYQEFWKRDLNEFIGKPFISYYSKTEAEARRVAA